MKRLCHNGRRCLPILRPPIFLIIFVTGQLCANEVNTASFAINTSSPPSYQVAVFYYPWYGNPANDGEWIHWDRDRDHVFFPTV